MHPSQPRVPDDGSQRAANRFRGVQQREEARARHAEKGRKAVRRIARDDRERQSRAGEDVSSSSSAGETDEDTETDTSVSSSCLEAEQLDVLQPTEEVGSSRHPDAPTPPRRDA